eukprot:3161352-Alexandrium_andersonii.AAC.1
MCIRDSLLLLLIGGRHRPPDLPKRAPPARAGGDLLEVWPRGTVAPSVKRRKRGVRGALPASLPARRFCWGFVLWALVVAKDGAENGKKPRF